MGCHGHARYLNEVGGLIHDGVHVSSSPPSLFPPSSPLLTRKAKREKKMEKAQPHRGGRIERSKREAKAHPKQSVF